MGLFRTLDDPVEAYDHVAPEFKRLSSFRQLYLKQVEQVIIAEIPAHKNSLLDVGAGDGQRSKRIAAACGMKKLVLLEPSAGMRGQALHHTEIWPIRAEQLNTRQGEFDAITCLWNVLGHIHPGEARTEVLRQFARLLAPGGLIFIDVNHRYNAREYGVFNTAGRYLHDLIRPSPRNGDVVARWNSPDFGCATRGHVFTDREMRESLSAVGLLLKKRVVIDYGSGQIRRWSFSGNLLYVLAKT